MILSQERTLLQKAIVQSSNGELDAESYVDGLERLLARRAELDRKLLAQVAELRSRLEKEEMAEKLLDDVFWS